MKKLIITTLAVLVLIGQIASAEIRQEYYFFPIGSWWNPMALKLTNTNIDTWWAPPDPDCFDAFNDFKLDWVRIDLYQSGLHFWDNANFDPLDPDNTRIPDSFEAYSRYIANMAHTGVRVSLAETAFSGRVYAWGMIYYNQPQPPKMCYHVGVKEGEGVTAYPDKYGPDGKHQYFHPFKQQWKPPEEPDEGYSEYFNDKPAFVTSDYVPADANTNYESFEYNTKTLYLPPELPKFPEGHNLTNPYDFYCDDLPENLYYFEAGHEEKQPHYSSVQQGFKFAREQFQLKEEGGKIYTPRFVSLVVGDESEETYRPYWVWELDNPDHARFRQFDFANVPDDIDNSLRWYLSWVNDDVLYARSTYPWRDYVPACSKQVYVGSDNRWVNWYTESTEPPYDWDTYIYSAKGFTQIQRMLNLIREAARVYQVPNWCIAHAGEDGRCPTPRELRSQVSMFLTYGMKGVIYYLLSSIQPDNNNRTTILNGLTYSSITEIAGGIEAYGTSHGQLRTDDYTVPFKIGEDDKVYLELPYPDLIDEVIAVNTKLDKLRHTIYTLDNHASIWLGEEGNPLPAHFIKGYSHNRVSSVPSNDPNSPQADHGTSILTKPPPIPNTTTQLMSARSPTKTGYATSPSPTASTTGFPTTTKTVPTTTPPIRTALACTHPATSCAASTTNITTAAQRIISTK